MHKRCISPPYLHGKPRFIAISESGPILLERSKIEEDLCLLQVPELTVYSIQPHIARRCCGSETSRHQAGYATTCLPLDIFYLIISCFHPGFL